MEQETLEETKIQPQSPAKKFSAGQFEGPLDLLWSLIRESKINIYDIPIAQITEQYLDYLDSIVETDLTDLSDFYSWAAKLVYIKSRMMLPVDVPFDGDDIEDPRQELVEKLIEYQKFKKLTELIFRTMVSKYSNEKVLNMYEEISVNEKITLMNEKLDEAGSCMFTDLITRRGNEMDVICAFMALLEAVKFKMATIFQSRLFGDIKICKYEAAA